LIYKVTILDKNYFHACQTPDCIEKETEKAIVSSHTHLLTNYMT